MGAFLVNPWLFIGGLIAIASPVIIHLLNRRRFKRVEWAAMDFLVEAQRLNRRRVKLEEFILLLMRCFAMALIGLLLARPFLDANPSGMFTSGQTERVIVLDDSLSMAATAGGDTPMGEASAMLGRWVEALAADGGDDLITVVRTTDPEKSSPNGLPLTEASMGALIEDFKNIESRDRGGDLGAALLHVEKSFKGDNASLNRVVYVLTDLRRKDWEGSAEEGSDAGVVATLKRISEKAAGCYVIDLGDDGEENLMVEEVRPLDKALLAGVPAEFEAVVRNAGSRDANDVTVRFAAGDTLPVEARIDSVPAGGTGVAAFTYTFASEAAEAGVRPEPVPVEVSIDVPAGEGSDLLAADNTRFYPARVVNGLRVLIVDGDPSGVYGQSESFYLKHALSPGGAARSGVEVTVVDDTEFDGADLSRFEVVVVANLYRVTAERAAALEAWVGEGGGLVFLLGDQVDEDVYNEVLFKEGNGLLPGRLTAIDGDEKEETWALLNPESDTHPVFGFFSGDNRQLLDGVKVFQWWGSVVSGAEETAEPEAAEAENTPDDPAAMRVIATFTDPAKTPAVVEKGFGEGRVVAWSTPLDNDWNTFPENGATFLIAAQELVRYMARDRTGEGSLRVGEPIRQNVDLREHRSQVGVVEPGTAEPKPAEAMLPEGAAEGNPVWELEFEETTKRGIYEVRLEPTDGGEPEVALFAANIDTAESDLQRASESAIRADLGDAAVQFVPRGQPVIELGAATARSEVWKLVLYVLAALLAAELLFGWWIGAKR